jgi:hypothetical protein
MNLKSQRESDLDLEVAQMMENEEAAASKCFSRQPEN